ncbi:TetR/AcrR family transcriptional regulator [Sphingomonas cavernae]|uniref:TetR/AcrR family transcriptional regulator n=1 Tax=Sphingomonas cavernae TaxID=2320861 RepID=UPI0015FEC121|nr:TetR/AcrR family transcriptional regulator [Sphingomonas cavernae]
MNTEARRTAIVEVAMLCFVRQGFQKTSISDICKEAGMRSGHYYYYFAGKGAILEVAYVSGNEDLAVRVEHMLDEQDLFPAILVIGICRLECRNPNLSEAFRWPPPKLTARYSAYG